MLSTVFNQEGSHGLQRHLLALKDIPVAARALQFCFEVRRSLFCSIALIYLFVNTCRLFFVLQYCAYQPNELQNRPDVTPVKPSTPEWESTFISALNVDVKNLLGDDKAADHLCKWVNEGDESGWHDMAMLLFADDSPTLALKQVDMIFSFLCSPVSHAPAWVSVSLLAAVPAFCEHYVSVLVFSFVFVLLLFGFPCPGMALRFSSFRRAADACL